MKKIMLLITGLIMASCSTTGEDEKIKTFSDYIQGKTIIDETGTELTHKKMTFEGLHDNTDAIVYRFDSAKDDNHGFYSPLGSSGFVGVGIEGDLAYMYKLDQLTTWATTNDVLFEEAHKIVVPMSKMFKEAIEGAKTVTYVKDDLIHSKEVTFTDGDAPDLTFSAIKTPSKAVYELASGYVGIEIADGTVNLYQQDKVTSWPNASAVLFEDAHKVSALAIFVEKAAKEVRPLGEDMITFELATGNGLNGTTLVYTYVQNVAGTDTGTFLKEKAIYKKSETEFFGMEYVAKENQIKLYRDASWATADAVKFEAGFLVTPVDTWEPVGTGLAEGIIHWPSTTIDANRNVYIAYSDGANGGKLTVQKYNKVSGAWELVGGKAGISATSAFHTAIVTHGNDIYVAYSPDTNNDTTTLASVMKWDGAKWITLGSTDGQAGIIGSLGYLPEFAIDKTDNTIYLAGSLDFKDPTSNKSKKSAVWKLDPAAAAASRWVKIGEFDSSATVASAIILPQPQLLTLIIQVKFGYGKV